jgi:hypothetical protein
MMKRMVISLLLALSASLAWCDETLLLNDSIPSSSDSVAMRFDEIAMQLDAIAMACDDASAKAGDADAVADACADRMQPSVDLITGEKHDFGGGSELPPYGCAFWKTER